MKQLLITLIISGIGLGAVYGKSDMAARVEAKMAKMVEEMQRLEMEQYELIKQDSIENFAERIEQENFRNQTRESFDDVIKNITQRTQDLITEIKSSEGEITSNTDAIIGTIESLATVHGQSQIISVSLNREIKQLQQLLRITDQLKNENISQASFDSQQDEILKEIEKIRQDREAKITEINQRDYTMTGGVIRFENNSRGPLPTQNPQTY